MEYSEQTVSDKKIQNLEQRADENDMYKVDTVILPRRLRLRHFANFSFGVKRKFFQRNRSSHSFHNLKVTRYLHLRTPYVDTYH
ncbi:MAG: hypothetical protein CME62_00350 [Halobacteriovoraceae bacterium]|nr:hypothetical protein [Halobacteriovoraceae bacterium]